MKTIIASHHRTLEFWKCCLAFSDWKSSINLLALSYRVRGGATSRLRNISVDREQLLIYFISCVNYTYNFIWNWSSFVIWLFITNFVTMLTFFHGSTILCKLNVKYFQKNISFLLFISMFIERSKEKQWHNFIIL